MNSVAYVTARISTPTIATHYYPQRDGHIAELDNESTTTAELLQARTDLAAATRYADQ